MRESGQPDQELRDPLWGGNQPFAAPRAQEQFADPRKAKIRADLFKRAEEYLEVTKFGKLLYKNYPNRLKGKLNWVYETQNDPKMLAKRKIVDRVVEILNDLSNGQKPDTDVLRQLYLDATIQEPLKSGGGCCRMMGRVSYRPHPKSRVSRLVVALCEAFDPSFYAYRSLRASSLNSTSDSAGTVQNVLGALS
jgi:hypothetical protein